METRLWQSIAMIKRLLKHDIMIAFLLLALSATTAGLVYARILRELENEIVVADSLRTGDQFFELRSHNSCVSVFKVQLNVSREESSLLTSGKANILASGVLIPVEVEGTANFNNLGQMGGIIWKLKTSNLEINIGAAGIRRMLATVKISGLGVAQKIQSEIIAGPFMLKKEEKDAYSISGQFPESFKDAYNNITVLSLEKDLGLSLAKIQDQRRECNTNLSVPLDISAPLNRVQALLKQ